MMMLLFLAPLVYWYITVPEIIYIIYAMLRSVANDGVPTLYGIGLAVYYVAFATNPKSTMIIAAILIVIDFMLHRGITIRNAPYYVTTSYSHDESDQNSYGYNDCPYCGSGDTDGNHCYDCDEDF